MGSDAPLSLAFLRHGSRDDRNWVAVDDVRRLTRELDIALNGEGAAKQASLCDIVAQVTSENWKLVRIVQHEITPPMDEADEARHEKPSIK